MQYFTGLDVSMKETSICIVDEKGKVAFETCVETQPLDIYQALQSTPLPIEIIGVESGSLSHWLVNQLLDLNLPVVCVDSRQMGVLLSLKVNKTDKNDAKVIANAMRTSNFQEVKLKSQEAVEISTLLTARATLIQQRTAIKNTVRGMIKLFGIRLKSRGKKGRPLRCAILSNRTSETPTPFTALKFSFFEFADEEDARELFRFA